MKPHLILGVHVTERLQNALPVQSLLTEYGAYIQTRLGLHEAGPDGICSGNNGLLLLEMVGDIQHGLDLAEKLGQISGIEVQKMVFDHPT